MLKHSPEALDTLTDHLRRSGQIPLVDINQAGMVVGGGSGSEAVKFGGKYIDVFTTQTPLIDSLNLPEAAEAFRASQSEAVKTLGGYAVPSNFFVGESPNGPAIHKVKTYVEGDSLDKIPVADILSNRELVSDLIQILNLTENHFRKTGHLFDLFGYVDNPSEWVGRLLSRTFLKSTNTIVEKATGRPLVVDCDSDPHAFNLEEITFLRKINIYSYVVGYKIARWVLKASLLYSNVKNRSESRTETKITS